jgi:predicted transposase YbfD/YdcC
LTFRKIGYIITIKRNQAKLYRAAVEKFESGCPVSVFTYYTKDKDRHTKYEVFVHRADSETAKEWSGLRYFVTVRRTGERAGKPWALTTHCIASLEWGAEKLGRAVQGHWAVENCLHWVKDAVMGEDAQRFGDQELSLKEAFLKSLTVNLLRRFDPRCSITAKIEAVAHNITEILKHCS